MISNTLSEKDLNLDIWREQYQDIFSQQKRYRNKLAIIGVVIVLFYVFFFQQFGVSQQMFIDGSQQLMRYFSNMFIWKDFANWPFSYYYSQILVTLAIVFGGTITASLVALPLSFFASRNIMKGPFAIVAFAMRKLFDVLRGIDMAIWGMIFVRAIGMGPLAGILAIFIQDLGLLGRLFAEGHEAADEKPSRGLTALGAQGLQKHRFGIFTQSFPTFLALSLYQIESNTRSAAVLGFVGAGGIGLVYAENMRLWNWDVVTFITLNLVVIVMVMDMISSKLRQKYIVGEDVPLFERKKV
ncbi:phosphonate ABC transporter, permease protein PhnE [Vibrio rumoiensis]|uniref:Phosphonate ABC transporter, permease protein PhnE n=1 Tax=Vibrio rumoiensis 1S-45 TaxID=1188252 RepID=A0A1E5E2E4_9VIBR|nr:phosphonate ABC transporter, permease protein PhnE [Vibrio rumoiensis]OEF25618.1 phosphonate ABC transporter, permease protein PhnE [Vibrio rumoiensis 1S-45]